MHYPLKEVRRPKVSANKPSLCHFKSYPFYPLLSLAKGNPTANFESIVREGRRPIKGLFHIPWLSFTSGFEWVKKTAKPCK